MANKRSRLDKRTLSVLGIVLGVQTIVCAGLVMSVHNKKAAMEQTLAGKETALNNVRTVSAGLPALQAQYGNMQAQVQFLEKGLPQPQYIPTLLGDIEKTAVSSGVKILEFRPKTAAAPTGAAPAASAGGTTQYQFEMNVTGSYGTVQKFLKNLTRFRKILALSSIKLQPAAGPKTSQSPSLTAALSLTAFVLPPSPAATPAAPGASVAGAPTPAPAATSGAKVAEGQGMAASKAVARG
ncbi:MAG TPA: type 4a pilus biogenesis protein PilO [Armatimonadota bacterium]|jgi:Tfp pilus assembly protein PilO